MSLPAHFTPIETREHLLGMLAEAAEIEHNLMCCYLYAAFSLKQGLDEGLTEDELVAVRRWRRAIVDVAIEEMAHLTMVANIMSAIGGTPHFGRQNFPIAPGFHPAGIVVKLAPFNPETLQHFIFLERPEGVAVPDGGGFDPPQIYERHQLPGRIMPSAQDYDTVGQLYDAIEDGLARLAERLGEETLFIGDPVRQIGPDVSNLPGILRVKCLKSALAAIDAIIVQGEGSPEGSHASHYQRFLAIRDEFTALQAANPAFRPARPAAHNPLMRKPAAGADRTWISASPAAEMLDLANAAYNQMLRLLNQAYAETRGPAQQRVFTQAATDLMFVIAPVASALTRYPAQGVDVSCTAGMSFATLRATTTLPVGPATDAIMIERMREIAEASARLEGAVLAAATGQLSRIVQDMEDGLMPPQDSAAPTPAAESALAPAPRAGPPIPVVENGVEHIEGNSLTLHFNAKRCIHARHCVLGQPGVFKANVEGPWIDPDATTTEGLVTVAHMCPSGAIAYTRKDGGPKEAKPPINLVQLRENGPLGLRGELRINGQPIGMRATLCRCGASRNKPYCDGSHHDIDFAATGEPETRPSEPLAVRGGVVDIRPQRNGPLEVRGNLEICAGTGRTVDRVAGTRLCRCGHSANKPFCDNSHERVGFIAD